ncbi:MAG: acyl-CoA/acyl-ACP dehydrogenase, partial [Acidobacteriota bacterium]|nr:acyl-CoA/acyl-ACP dehydrogenase [Acidobacteriota bacterium]
IDTSGKIPEVVGAAVAAVVNWGLSPLGTVLALEELAVTSASAAAGAVLGGVDGAGLTGLRGVALVDDPTDQQQLGLASVCVGIGRAALSEALGLLRRRGDRPSGEPADAPHWVLADAATELEAARLLVRSAAQGGGPGAASALVFAGRAAFQAVEAAVRLVGVDACRPGSTLERCGRDVRAARLVLGTEDRVRLRAADRLLA